METYTIAYTNNVIGKILKFRSLKANNLKHLAIVYWSLFKRMKQVLVIFIKELCSNKTASWNGDKAEIFDSHLQCQWGKHKRK